MQRLRLPTLDADLDVSLAALRQDAGAVVASRRLVEAALDDGEPHYGLNTGFGALAQVRIELADVARLQENLLRSHAVGMGSDVPRHLSRRMLRLKIHALGLGFSGVSEDVFRRLLEMAERDLVPAVPSRGSLGASGDLAPLAHLALPLIGEGRIWESRSASEEGAGPRPAGEVLAAAGLTPVKLRAKDGLALINGTQFMQAYASEAIERAERIARTADVLAALSLESARGSVRPFDERVHAVRPHPGHGRVASNVRRLLEGSEILPSHVDCGKVQDPYSIRCVPQVHGAGRDALAWVAGVVEMELNSVTDNPLVFEDAAGGADLVSAGNFHGQPLAIALDTLAIAVAEWASISERRTYLLLDGYDGLPPFLVQGSGLDSGFMIPQYAAAALVSENKTLCHPASVDSIPSSRGQEDHVSMGAWGAIKALMVVENVERVLAIEALTAAQALDFRRPFRAGRGVEAVHAAIRGRVEFRRHDALFDSDLAAAFDLVAGGGLVAAAESEIGALQ